MPLSCRQGARAWSSSSTAPAAKGTGPGMGSAARLWSPPAPLRRPNRPQGGLVHPSRLAAHQVQSRHSAPGAFAPGLGAREDVVGRAHLAMVRGVCGGRATRARLAPAGDHPPLDIKFMVLEEIAATTAPPLCRCCAPGSPRGPRRAHGHQPDAGSVGRKRLAASAAPLRG